MSLALATAEAVTPPCFASSGWEVALETLQAWIPQMAVAALALGLLLTIAVALLAARVGRFARPFDELARLAQDGDTPAALQAQLRAVTENRKRIEDTLAYVRRLRAQARSAVQGIGFLRYDAFDDIRGKQSYSLCLLDAHRNGILLTSIAGRADSRGYAKPIHDGTCELALSEEETGVLDAALESLHEVDEPVVVGV
jgi:hypothetical protein